MKTETGEVVTVDVTEIEELIKRIAGYPETADRNLEMGLLRLLIHLIIEIGSENPTVKSLRRLIGCKQPKEGEDRQEGSHSSGEDRSERPGSDQQAGEKAPGHGRRASGEYQVSSSVQCEHPELRVGDGCPRTGCRGRMYDTRDPQVLIRLEGNPMISATRFEQQVLRCSACGDRFAAGLPKGVTAEKYDATADTMIAVMKYGLGMPWHRQRRLQDLMGVPLAESTQFERCEQLADRVLPVYLQLERLAASSDVLHHDDTGVKILSYMKDNRDLGDKDRKGMHTTGIGAAGAHPIALYASGRRHAGENLARLLAKRPTGLDPPIVMGDAEAKNWTADFKQIVSKCLQHGRRQFTEIASEFPDECRRVLNNLGQVYSNEAQTRTMTGAERLLYHQLNSKPILDQLRDWCQRQFDQRLVEPNSNLGRAIRYLLRHWSGLTRFLDAEGAPLDNNFVERVLKRVVLHRKNAMFYKTAHGAAVGDILMSLIETCALNKVNPFNYLTTLVRQSVRVRQAPSQWLPWNYSDKECKSRAA